MTIEQTFYIIILVKLYLSGFYGLMPSHLYFIIINKIKFQLLCDYAGLWQIQSHNAYLIVQNFGGVNFWQIKLEYAFGW